MKNGDGTSYKGISLFKQHFLDYIYIVVLAKIKAEFAGH